MFFGGLFVGVVVAFALVIIIAKGQTKKLKEKTKLIERETEDLKQEGKYIREQTRLLDQELNIQLINRYDGYNLFNIVDYSKIDNEVFSKFIFGVEQ